VDVCYSEEEVKAMAEDTDVIDGPNDEGEMFERPGAPQRRMRTSGRVMRWFRATYRPRRIRLTDLPWSVSTGKLSDYLPSPYPNEEAARYANNGAYPPDLSLIMKARHNGPDYVFALLVGYKDPPAGIAARETQYYNPYFPGAWIGMPPPLNDGAVEYDDGTPATATQMAKDVCTFLTWAAEPEADERKLMGVKWMITLTVLFGFTWYYKRVRWAPIKTRRLELY